eukprot:14826360-Heterocapsa_arctica.AAC.1
MKCFAALEECREETLPETDVDTERLGSDFRYESYKITYQSFIEEYERFHDMKEHRLKIEQMVIELEEQRTLAQWAQQEADR